MPIGRCVEVFTLSFFPPTPQFIFNKERYVRRGHSEGKEVASMAENRPGNYQLKRRRPYVKPFIRNLDAADTEGKTDPMYDEFCCTYGGADIGPGS